MLSQTSKRPKAADNSDSDVIAVGEDRRRPAEEPLTTFRITFGADNSLLDKSPEEVLAIKRCVF